MNEKTELDKALRGYKRFFFYSFLYGVCMLGIMTYWIIGKEEIIDIAEQIIFLKVFIKQLHGMTAQGIFLICLISFVLSSAQAYKLYKILLLVNERLKNNQTNS